MQVLKFGGTSVANADRLSIVSKICGSKYAEHGGLCVIVSAFSGITDLLIKMTDLAEKGHSYTEELNYFKSKVYEVADGLLSPDTLEKINTELTENHQVLGNLLSGVALIQEASDRTRDYILSFGERNCAFLLTHYLIQEKLPAQYIDARKYVKTNSSYGAARVNFEETNKLIGDLNQQGTIYVVTGFIGSDFDSGRTTTLGRGGSDYSAAIFAAAMDANELEIWTDVDGVLTSDPRKVKKAYTVDELSYAEAMEMSHFGAKVLYSPTIRPVREKGIPTLIKNTFNPDHKGTIIHHNKSKNNKIISGLSSISDIALVSLQGTGMQGVTGIATRFFHSLSEAGINVIMITQASSEHSITVGISQAESDKATAILSKEFEFEIKRQLIDPIVVQNKKSLIAIIGENMKNSFGVAGKLFQTLGKNGINIEAIAQGSSELNITFAIDHQDLSKALNTIHDAFFLSDYKTIHLFMIGVGLIGKTLLEQINSNFEKIKTDNGKELVFCGISNSRKMIISESAIDITHISNTLDIDGESADINSFVDRMIEMNLANTIFVDCTASAMVPQHYARILENNIAISTPNKIALSSDLSAYKNLKAISLKNSAAFNYETNVGAGLPVIATLQNLVNSGDEITKIEAVLSGSLSFIFNNYNNDVPFSDLVRKAKEIGYTEPDPREDLSGNDVRRKLLILARESGAMISNEDIAVEALLPQSCMDADNVETFFGLLEKENPQFAKLYDAAQAENKRLRFIASYHNGKGQIALKAVDQSSPFYSLKGSDNMIAYYSTRYDKAPLVVRGPGAGPQVTAAGVLAEIINMSNTL